MLTGELRSQIDRIWDSFWSGGISNPMEVMEQITYLLFMRRLDELHTLEENKANRLGQPIEKPVFPQGNDPKGRPYADLRWSHFKDSEPRKMYELVAGFLIRLRTNSENDPEYLAAFLNCSYSKRMLRAMGKSIVGMANINATEIQAMRISRPDLKLQPAFALRVVAVGALKAVHRIALSKLDTLFAFLQHRAFRGEL